MSSPDHRRLPLTVVVLTLNEERHLHACLSSARQLTERFLVLDSGSTDHTLDIARSHGADVRSRAFDGYANQRNAALEMVDDAWVLFLDADEVITEPLAAEIRTALGSVDPDVAGFWIPRQNLLGQTWLRGGGWWPDEQLRLMRPERSRYDPQFQIHERPKVAGRHERMSSPLIHHNFESIAEFCAIQRRYSDMLIEHYLSRGEFGRRRSIVGRPVREFWRRCVQLRGYRNGPLGLYLSLAMAWYELRTWRHVRARVRRGEIASPAPSERVVHLADPDPSLDISVIIVSYNTSDLLSKCLVSIEAWFDANGHTGEVIVVDNASTDGTANMVSRRFPSVRLIENSSNAGFAAATNQGILAARGRYLVLLNPDTTVVGDAFGILSDYMDRHPEVAVAGPRLTYPDGTVQSSRRRFPTRMTGFLESTLIQDYWKDNRVLQRYYMEDRPDDKCQPVDWLVGACLIARRDAIESVGLLDERFFMYSEEIEWCHRMKRAGWQIMYLPGANVIHHEGSSSGQNVPVRQINFDTSKVLLYEQLHGKATARMLHLFLLTTYMIRIGAESAKGLIGHKRSLRRARVSMYCRVLAARIRGSGGT